MLRPPRRTFMSAAGMPEYELEECGHGQAAFPIAREGYTNALSLR
jgi:hypothetical protein